MTGRNPSAIPADTSTDAWRVQMNAIRGMAPQERIRRWEEFNDALAEMELAALRRKYPHASERQRFLIRMRLKYGSELAAQIWPEASEDPQ